jgi:AraC-like DNA-binding protein
MIAQLEQRTRAEFEDEPERTHLDYVADWQASGKTLRALCREINVSPPMLSDYLRVEFGAEVARDALSRARENAAHLLAEESMEIADDATPAVAQVANLQVRTRQWVAERWNRRELGNQAGATLNISIGALMLDALRQPVPIQATSAIVDAIALPSNSLTPDESVSYEVE